jgi:hypothetical protein
MSRAGMLKKEEIKDIIISAPKIKSNEFATCRVSINNSIEKVIVSDLTDPDLITKVKRYVNKIDSINVIEILKLCRKA